jgi:hypothetical protein
MAAGNSLRVSADYWEVADGCLVFRVYRMSEKESGVEAFGRGAWLHVEEKK